MKHFWKDDAVKKNLFTGSVLILLFICLYNISHLIGIGKTVLSVLNPFLLGSAIAFILNVPMKKIEDSHFQAEKYQTEKWKKRKRSLSLLVTIFLAIVVIIFVLNLVVPKLSETISQIIKQIPTGISRLEAWADGLITRFPMLETVIQNAADNWQSLVQSLTSTLRSSGSKLLSGGFSAVSGFFSGLTNFIIGFIFAIYILTSKEKLGVQAKKVVYAVFSQKNATRVMEVSALSYKAFSSFISGQCVEAVILGCLFFVSMLLLQLPYAPLISVLIAVLALIPIVGSFIGCGIGVLLILLVSPVKAIIFLVWFLILQQIEGNLIYPYVVGNSVGLPGIWVLVSVTLGGSLFGVTGMLIFIPLTAVVYTLFKRFIARRLRDKNIRITEHGEIKDWDEDTEGSSSADAPSMENASAVDSSTNDSPKQDSPK